MTVQDIDRSTFEADWAAWHQRHEELRAGPHGFLAITGRHWLTPEPQRFDDAPGAWSAADDTVTVTLGDDEDLAVDGEPVHGTYTFSPIPERGQVNATAGYAGTEAYAPDPHWVIEGRYLPYDEPRDVTVGAVVEGLQHVYETPGEIEFAVDGQTLRLIAFNGYKPGSLGVLFTDATSGVTTYPANRSLEVAAPAADGAVILDFNHAVNLPCAYTEFATCPLPPAGNHLPVAVEAGEKLPREQHPPAGRVP